MFAINPEYASNQVVEVTTSRDSNTAIKTLRSGHNQEAHVLTPLTPPTAVDLHQLFVAALLTGQRQESTRKSRKVFTSDSPSGATHDNDTV